MSRQVNTTSSGTFGSRLRFARVSADLTQEQLARQVDTTLRTLQRWEKDESEPRGSQVAALALALHVPVEGFYPPSKEAA